MASGPYRSAELREHLEAIARSGGPLDCHLIFVCLGNICRSPFAEHYARQLLPETVRIESRGTYPHDNRRTPAEGLRAARDFEVDLGDHRSRILDAADVESADLLLVFDRWNLETVEASFPESCPKLYRLGALSPLAPEELHDPYGSDQAEYRGAYGAIARAVDELVLTLRGPK